MAGRNESIQFQREQLAAIVESSQDAIISKSIEGVIISWNAAATRLFGYTSSEAVGRHIYLIIPPDRRDEERSILERLRRGERIEHYETVRQRKDGTCVEISLSISPLRDVSGRVVGASKIARDISGRKAAERVLRESEARYRSLVEASGAIVFNADAQARWLVPHPAWEAYTGQLCEQSRGRGWIEAIHPEDRRRVQDVVDAAVASDAPWEVQSRIWHAPTHDWRHQEIRAVPIRIAIGERNEYVGTCLDVHARREAEEALRTSDRRKDEFLAVLAHELRNPLAPIANAMEVLQAGGLDPAAARHLAEVAGRQVRHLARLVDDLLEISRITCGRLELEREPLLLDAVLNEAIEITRPLIDERAHTLDASHAPQPLTVHGDRTRLVQIIANLLDNAAKYTPRGGRIRLFAVRDGASAVITVADNGMGIAPELLTHVFKMFAQLDPAADSTKGGLGIGLSLVHRLVELHGGRVEARSAGPGRGSEFIVHLPLAPEARITPSADTPPAGRLPQRRVLVADDNEDAARTLSILLHMLGQKVYVVHDGEAAVERAGELRPHLAMLDIGMPRLNGHEAAQRIRAQPWGKEMLLVALTGWDQEQDRKRSIESGFDRHLVKPVYMEVLRELLTLSSRGTATESEPGRPH